MDELNMQKPEVPIIVIERDEEPQAATSVTTAVGPSRKRKWLKWLLALVAVGCLMAAALAAYHQLNYYYHIGVPVSVSPAQNIEKLQQPAKQEPPAVVMTADSILGVAMDFYAIHGLKAAIEFNEPDTADASVYLYCRSVDYTAEGKYLGSLVAEGVEKRSDRSRLGYMAMADGNMVIGVSRSEKVKDYVTERGGSFFRQFILVSDGVIPARFYLHGKVERRAIGRIGDRLYFIATRHKETLYDFADALREYGFIDAIYITGGLSHVFCRTADGVRHDIGDAPEHSPKEGDGTVPWLVFRK